jgi:hypothetical protein
MAWSYSGNPASSDLDKVRFLIGDTNTANQLLSNEEITWLLAEWNDNAYVAAANAAYSLSAEFSGKSDFSRSVGDLSLSTQYGAQAERYGALAQRLQVQAAAGTPPLVRYSTDSEGNVFGPQVFSIGMEENHG